MKDEVTYNREIVLLPYITICDDITISILWGNTAYCVKLTGEDLSRYSSKTQSAGLRKCPYYHYVSKHFA